ncbi:UBP-type zinc finger domain-containing protein [Chitinophagaceae bacterium MMS25-I14]
MKYEHEDPNECSHMAAMDNIIHPHKHECAECIKAGSEWLHLRTCQTCGATLCCDDSPLKHMTQHYHETGHPVVISAEPGERWLWCYDHEQIAVY